MQCITASKKKLTLITEGSKRGGEGSIYRVAGQPKVVAKIYHASMASADKRRKLEAMLASPPKLLPKSCNLVWPQDILLK